MRQGHVPPHGKHGGQNMEDERGWAYYSTSIKQTRRPRPYQWSWKSVIIGIFWWTLMKLTAGMPIPLFFTASSSNGTPTLCCAHPSPFLPWGSAMLLCELEPALTLGHLWSCPLALLQLSWQVTSWLFSCWCFWLSPFPPLPAQWASSAQQPFPLGLLLLLLNDSRV